MLLEDMIHNLNTIEYITIATTGNATDFGDLTTASRLKETSCISNSWSICWRMLQDTSAMIQLIM